MKKTYVQILKSMKNGVEEVEINVYVKGQKQSISENLREVILKENKLSEMMCERIYKDENIYQTKRPKGYYKILAKEVGAEKLLLAIKELRRLSRNLPALEMSRVQELKIALMK